MSVRLTETELVNIGLLRLGLPFIIDITADSQDGIPFSQYRGIQLGWKVSKGIVATEHTWWELRKTCKLDSPLGDKEPGYERYHVYLLPSDYANTYCITNSEGIIMPSIRSVVKDNRIYVEPVENAVLHYTSNDLSKGVRAGDLAELFGLKVASTLAKPDREDRTLGERLKSEYSKVLYNAEYENDRTEIKMSLNPTEMVNGRFFGRGYGSVTNSFEFFGENINPTPPIPRPKPTERN